MKYDKFIFYFLLLPFLVSCKPVNFFTTVNRTPREHSLNLCLSEIKAPRTVYNKEGWVVFSDREANPTYREAGGKIVMNEMAFGEPFFVVKRKGDYLALIKYDPEVLGGNLRKRRLADRKKAEFYGWVHRSRMLLTKQSAMDIATGFKNKAVIAIGDSLPVVHPEEYFGEGTVWAYKDESLTDRHRQIPVNEVVYPMKRSRDGKSMLVSSVEFLSPPDEPEEEGPGQPLGWVPCSLVQESGQRLHVDLTAAPAFPDTSFYSFSDVEKSAKLKLTSRDLQRIDLLRESAPLFRYNPVLSRCRIDSCCATFRTILTERVLDKRLNYIFNVDGNKIMYDDVPVLNKELKKINLFFVFEGTNQVQRDFSQLLNVVQNLGDRFENDSCGVEYKFGAVLTARNRRTGGGEVTATLEPTASYNRLMDFLTEESEKINNRTYMEAPHSWKALRTAVDMAEELKRETNLLILTGESGHSEWADSILVKRMAAANCRVLGYQVNSEISDAGNNFVLQVENMIDNLAGRLAVKKRELIVFPHQIKTENSYREVARNMYALDYPEKSMSQGWILFPDKFSTVPTDMFSQAIDTFVCEVRRDNLDLLENIRYAFRTVGTNRDVYGDLWTAWNKQDTSWEPLIPFMKRFTEVEPVFRLESGSVQLSQEEIDYLDYHLLLSGQEYDQLTGLLERLASLEPEYIDRKKGRKKGNRLCDCPDDIPVVVVDTVWGPNGVYYYKNTRSLRRKMYRIYRDEIKGTAICKPRFREMRRMNLAQCHELIFGAPVTETVMKTHTLKKIKRKRKITDWQLDQLVYYFKAKNILLNADLKENPGNKFQSNGNTFYWVDRELLP